MPIDIATDRIDLQAQQRAREADVWLEAKINRILDEREGNRMVMLDGPGSSYRDELPVISPTATKSKEQASEQAEAVVTGEICKLTGGKDWFGAYNTECVEVDLQEAKGNELSWFERQEARVDRIIADQREEQRRKITEIEEKSYRGFSGSCFTANALLLKSDGATISFGELASLQNNGAPLPELASWNEANNQVIYQRPSFVIDHGILNSTLMYVAAQDETGANTPLQVTENHPLLVEREGLRDWVKAGELQDGDVLVAPNGGYSFDKAATLAVEGGFGLFDLSFMTESGVESPTYLVSTDGVTWFVAHNKLM